MEWILIGLMIAIGFYIAPMIITLVVMLFVSVIGLFVVILDSIFGDKKG